MKNPRDTHFAGFAQLLMDEMFAVEGGFFIDISTDGLDDEKIATYRQIIARRAFDLACYILYETGYGLDLFNIPERVQEIPDFTKWPEVTQ